MALFRRILPIAVVLCGLILAGVVGIVASIDPNRFKPEIVSVASQQGGMALALDGPIGWRFWPTIGLSLADVRADWQQEGAQAQAVDGTPLLSLSSLALDVRVLPLLSLSPRLEIEGVSLSGARIHLERDAAGRVNWTPPAPESPAPAPAAGLSPAAIGLASLRIDDAALTYVDESAGQRVEVTELSVSVQGFAAGGEFPVSAHFRVALDAERSATVDLTGEGSLDGQGDRLAFAPLSLRVAYAEPGRGQVPIELGGAFSYAFGSGALGVDDGSIVLAGLQGTFRLQVAAAADGARAFSGLLTLPAQDSAPLAALLGRTDLPARVGLDVEFEGDDAAIRSPRLSLLAGETTLAGDATLQLAPRRRLNFALSAASLDLAAATDTASGPAPTPPSGSAGGAPPAADLEAPLLPIEALREFDWDGLLSVDSVRRGEQALQGVSLSTRNARGDIAVDISVRELFGGSLTARIGIDATAASEVPVWHITHEVRGIDAQAIPGAVDRRVDLTARIDGVASLEARGNTRAALGDSLSGTLAFDAGRGTLDVGGLKREAGVVAALAQALGRTDPLAAWPDVVEYRRFAGQVRLAGLADQKVDVAIDNLALAATGAYDQAANAIDYNVEMTVRADPQPTFPVVDYLVDVPLPMRCAGPLDGDGALCGIERDGVQRALAAALRNEAGNRLRDKVTEKVPEGLRDAAKGLFDRLRGR